MSEFTLSSYQKLFEVRILHHYWLDEGEDDFDSFDVNKQVDLLLHYDVTKILTVIPAPDTEAILKGHQCLFKMSPVGFAVAIPKGMTVNDDIVLEFFVKIIDPRFYNYTSGTYIKKNVTEIYFETEKRTLRYKENVPVFSNLTGTKRGVSPDFNFFLSTEIPALTSTDLVESIVKIGNALHQLTTDQPNAEKQMLDSNLGNAPVYHHQGDVVAITPPAGIIGAPAKGIELLNEWPNDIYALIRIGMVHPTDAYFDVTQNQKAKGKSPVFQIRFKNRSSFWKYLSKVFQIRFKNRSSFWKYLSKKDGSVISIENDPLPLTFSGNAGTKQKPQGLVQKGKLNQADTVEHLISEIFV
jgi:hypothetical protein